MDVDDVKNIGNNLPNNVETPNNIPKPNTELVEKVTTPRQEDILDPEAQQEENNSNLNTHSNSNPQGDNAPQEEGEREDVLDPEAEKEKGGNDSRKKKDKKDDDGDDSEGDSTKGDNKDSEEESDDSDGSDDKKDENSQDDSNSDEDNAKSDNDSNQKNDSSNNNNEPSDSSSSSNNQGNDSSSSGQNEGANRSSDVGGNNSSGDPGSSPNPQSSGANNSGNGLNTSPDLGGGGSGKLPGGEMGNTPNLSGSTPTSPTPASPTPASPTPASPTPASLTPAPTTPAPTTPVPATPVGGAAGGVGGAAGGAGGAAGGAGGAAGGAGGAAGIFNPYVLAAIAIIIIIIILIGLIGFMQNMPGLMVGKLKDIAQGLWDSIESMFGETEAEAFINDDDVTKLAQYLVDMDYDLIGYGFVRAKEEGDEKTFLELEEEGYVVNVEGQYVKIDESGNETPYNGFYYNGLGYLIDNTIVSEVEEDKLGVSGDYIKDKYGIRYWASDGEKDGVSHVKGQIAEVRDSEGFAAFSGGLITGATGDDSLLRAYLMADYRITVLKNDDERLLDDVGKCFSRIFGGATNAWSKGLIKLYVKEGNSVIDFYSKLNSGLDVYSVLYRKWWTEAEIIDAGTKLSIKNGAFNRPMEFELDGWTGRYGLSLEFLLSLHLGTMAPDLVSAMLQSFDTEVQVYVESIEDAQVLSKYKDFKVDTFEEEEGLNEEEVTLDIINTALDDEGYADVADGALIEWTNELALTKKKCQEILLNTGLSSPENCIYTAADYVILHMQSHYKEWFNSSYNYLKVDYGVTDPQLEEFDYKVSEDGDSDKSYTPDNSLFSLREDYQVGEGTDPNDEKIKTGFDEYVYPDRETAKTVAKDYGMEDSDIAHVLDSHFVTGAANKTVNSEVIATDNYIYRIEKDVDIAEWSIYGYLDGDEFKLVSEDTFNSDTENKYEETTAYYNSYMYKIYQVGFVDGGVNKYYRDGAVDPKGRFITKFSYAGDKEVSVFYNPSIGAEHFEQNFICYDKDGNVITNYDGTTGLSYGGLFGNYASITLHSTLTTSFTITTTNTYTLKIKLDGENVVFELEHSQLTTDSMNPTAMPIPITSTEEVVFAKSSIESGGAAAISGEVLYDVLYMNFVVRDKSLEELVACGVLRKEGDKYVPNEDAGKCSADKDLQKCCTICQRYVKGVVRALAQVQDTNYAYYQPYIARVVGSWFRDTYFIIPDSEDGALSSYYGSGNAPVGSWGSGGAYVKVDEDYLFATNEYWTEYEMKLDPDTGEETDAYQLYYLNPDGTTSNTKLEDWLEEEHDGVTYNSKEQAEKDGYVFVKRAKLLSLQDVKDNTLKDDEHEEGRDLEEKPYMDGTLWSAYTVGSGGDTGWTKINRGEIENVDKVLDMVDDKGEFYYKLVDTKSIEQVEDAIRTETNATVKNLFRYRQYYIYDGSTSKAEAIQADREKVLDLIIAYFNSGSYSKSNAKDAVATYGRYATREAYTGDTITSLIEDEQLAESWLEWQLDMYYRAGNENDLSEDEKTRFKLDELCEYGINHSYTNDEGETVTYLDKDYYTSDGHSLDPRDRNLISTVNITKSSLDAFAILENVNTLDSDYQYRDFKELVVELNYFDKEDLSESIEEVFTWLVPTYTTRWPLLSIDKQNNEYGTLVHSQSSIDFLIQVYEKLVEKEKAAKAEDAEGVEGETEEDIEDTEVATEEIDMSKVYYIGDSWFDNGGLKDVAESGEDYFTAHTGKSAKDSEYDNISVKSDATAIVVMLGLNDSTSQEDMKTLIDDLSYRYSDKTIYVLKVFHVGRNYTNPNIDKDTLNANIDKYNEDIGAHCAGKSNVKFVDATEGLIDDEGYLNPSFEADDGMHLTSYSKLYENIKTIVKEGSAAARPQSENEFILQQLKETTAYVENDSVISPVTGKIIAYGEHKRPNIYTEELETVGYVKIQVMNYGENKTDAAKSYFTKGMLSGTSLSDEEKDEAVKGLNSFYDEYEDQCAGYILMIDGIDITDLKNGFTGLTDAEGNSIEYDSLCQYETEERLALYNSKEKERREKENEAKTNAPYFIDYNSNYEETDGEYFAQDDLGGYYIKEGAYLGKVLEPTDRTGEKAEPNVGVQKENPNLSEDSVLVEEDPEKSVDIRLLYNEFLEEGKNPNYLRMILLDDELTVVDNVEDYFPGFEEESGSSSGKGIYKDLEAINESSSFEEKLLAAMSYFVGQGFTNEAAAGIVGNMIKESSLNPEADNGIGYHGLCQWNTNYNWWQNICAWTSEQGYNMYDFAGQVRAVYESPHRGGMSDDKWEELKILTDTAKAAELFCVYYEAPVGGSDAPEWYGIGELYQGLNGRKDLAAQALEVYLGNIETIDWDAVR